MIVRKTDRRTAIKAADNSTRLPQLWRLPLRP